MATLTELRELATGGDGSALRVKIVVAITIKANEIVNSATPTTAELAWARNALSRPEQYEQIVLHTALAQNAAATKAQIAAATDAAVQTVVDNVVTKLLAV